jgi:dienelactone hydrolase
MIRATLTALAIILPGTALADMPLSEDVTIERPGQDVIGTLVLPTVENPPVVLLLHGFTGSRDELATEAVPDGVFASAAMQLADAGYASLRIDFAGSGEATDEMSYAETTLEGQIADAMAAIAYLQGLDSVATDDLFLIGWSQGGLVAAATAGRSDALEAVALWNAVATPRETYAGFLTEETVLAGLAAADDAPVAVTLPWAEITLNGAFSTVSKRSIQWRRSRPMAARSSLRRAVSDTTVPPASADLYLAAHDGPETLWTAEMDHVFNIFETAEVLDEMIAANIAFFDEHAD